MRERQRGEPECGDMATDSTGEFGGGRAGVYLNCIRPDGHSGNHRAQGLFWGDDYKNRISIAYRSKRQKADYLKRRDSKVKNDGL